MFRKCPLILTLVIILLSSAGSVFGEELNSINSFDTTKVNKGLITVNYEVEEASKIMKVLIQKGETRYFYNLDKNNTFPLQLGNGEYTVAILEKVAGNKFKINESKKLVFDLINENDVFLNSIQKVNWHPEMTAIKKAIELTENLNTDIEKVTAIYNYIINNLSYDDKKYLNINPDYVPNIEKIFKTSSGICYDYASLFASMLRSVGIPTKLVMGYKNDIKDYHAWNMVYLDDTTEWITIDTTYDSIMLQEGFKHSMEKDADNYRVYKQY